MALESNDDIVIVDAIRTPIGSFNGGLSSLSAVELGTHVIKALLERNPAAKEGMSEVILGQVLCAGSGQNPARQSLIHAGLADQVSAMTINKVCGSGLKAIQLGAQALICNDADIIIAGGQESMSQSAHVLPKSRSGKMMGDWSMIDTMIKDGLWDAFNDYHMGITAENIAQQFNISREQQDQFAFNSQQKALRAQQHDRFKDEILSIEVQQKKTTTILDTDEYPRADTSLESLARLGPAFKLDGSVTAGNASGLNDGAAAVLMMRLSTAQKLGLTPMVKITASASGGVDPKIMGTGPISASTECLKKAQWHVDDLDLIEANEAFAAQAMCVNQAMGWNTDIVNVNGGAIALGHPIGASGARILTTLIHEMKRRDVNKGLATLCIGGGMGIAMAIENIR